MNVAGAVCACDYCALITGLLQPDSDPVIDCHPQHQNIIIGAGFSHGFKMAPVVGKMLSELALGLSPSHNLSHFKINRFDTPRAVL